MHKTTLRWAAGLALLGSALLAQAAPPKEVRLDYAYYAPTSLVLKEQGLLEKRLGEQGIAVRWVFSQGSNRSLEYLNSGSTDFASTAGLAALLSRANGAPIETLYLASRPEWTALVVPKDSPLKSLADLKGKKIAATKGTDPYLFLLRSLREAGLKKGDVDIVHLQHPDGRAALERGQVDAWAGLDPHMAASELQAGSRLLYRNLDFNSYGVLSTTEAFAKAQPELVKAVLGAYEDARHWTLAHPQETAELLAKASGLPLEVAQRQLARTDFSQPLPGPQFVAALKGAAPLLAEAGRTPEVAPIFETPGVLTPRGKVVFEPSIQYGYSSSNRVALVGYTVIPAILIGLLDVREVKRNTTTGAATFRYGLGNRLEIEGKIPYVYRSDATVSREIFTGTAAERAFNTSGKGVGDMELGMRYQINEGGVDKPYYIAGLRFKSRTGRDPFEVVTDCATRCVGQNVTGTGLPLDLPTGSGFYSLQPSLTWLLPSDPAIFFGSFSYTHNFKRGNIYRTVLNGDRELLGDIEPGDVFGFNVGMGLALNEKASFSIGYDHNSVSRMRQNGVVIPGSVRIQLGTLLLGGSYRLSNNRTLNLSVGAGLTRDTPDVTLMIRMPFNL